ncbi:MAG TPA: hypothetical protein PLG16_02690 [Planctomycetota bacterium]|nr:hypothetical protein [Planctomycetota bacterium]
MLWGSVSCSGEEICSGAVSVALGRRFALGSGSCSGAVSVALGRRFALGSGSCSGEWKLLWVGNLLWGDLLWGVEVALGRQKIRLDFNSNQVFKKVIVVFSLFNFCFLIF